MKIRELSWSSHATVDREPRMLAILMTVGFGEVYQIKEDFVPGRQRIFTDTGCILIVENMRVITGFVASFDQMTEYFDGKVPYQIRQTVRHSRKMIARYEGTL